MPWLSSYFLLRKVFNRFVGDRKHFKKAKKCASYYNNMPEKFNLENSFTGQKKSQCILHIRKPEDSSPGIEKFREVFDMLTLKYGDPVLSPHTKGYKTYAFSLQMFAGFQ